MNESTIKCPNPECGAENPANAKFCRMCGKPIKKNMIAKIKYRLTLIGEDLLRPIEWSNNPSKAHASNKAFVFTPDLFPSIQFTPCAVEKIDFKCRGVLIAISVFIILLVLYDIFGYKVDSFLVYELDFPMPVLIPIILYGAIVIILIPLLKRSIKKMKYYLNADYIETTPFTQELHRIAKNQRLGVFDKNSHSTIIRSKYSKITLFDAEHLLIEKEDGLVGLYSIKKRRFIVPIRYEKIYAFKNSIVKCDKDSQSYYYDIYGHRMK